MKEATGELNMTVITIVAIAAIAGLFAILWPGIRDRINNQWDNVDNENKTIVNTKKPAATKS